MLKASVLALTVAVALAAPRGHVAQVHEHIKNQECLEKYIRPSAPACVKGAADGTGACFPHGTDAINDCRSATKWQWHHADDRTMQYAPGVLPPPHRRMTHNGGDKKKIIWTYAAAITQAKAVQVYPREDMVDVEDMKKTPINQVSFIANVNIDKPTGWFKPGENNTEGCGQKQTP